MHYVFKNQIEYHTVNTRYKAFRGVAMDDFLPDKDDLARWNAWFLEVTSNETIKPILADKARLEKAYKIYTTGEGPAQALKAIKKGEAPP